MPLPWPFILQRTVFLSTLIDVPHDAVLQYLHDPQRMIGGGPLVIECKADPSNPLKYTITDKLDALGIWSTTTQYDAIFEPKEDGTDVMVEASLGTRLQQKWRVRSTPEQTAEMTEEVTVQAIFFFMPYFFKTMTKSHREGNERVKDELEKKHGSIRVTLVNSTLREPPARPTGITILILCVAALIYASHRVVALLILGAILLRHEFNSKDPYGLFHLALNKSNGDPPNVDPRTEWLNMGFWKDTTDFPTACEALALRMISAAQLKPNSKILDVGHGTGESLVLLLTHPSVQKPAHLYGITSLPAHARRSAQRVEHVLNALPEPCCPQSVTIYCADAVRRSSHAEHPFDPSNSLLFDSILALDCAYHFETRSAFLQQALEKLEPGGRIALADIVFGGSAFPGYRSEAIRALMRMMPAANILTPTAYVANMERMGFVDVSLEDVTDDVFPGFVRFLKSRGGGWWAFGSLMEVYFGAGARFVIVSGQRASAW